MKLKQLTPHEKLDLVRSSAYRGGQLFADGIAAGKDPLELIETFRTDMNRVLDLIEEFKENAE